MKIYLPIIFAVIICISKNLKIWVKLKIEIKIWLKISEQLKIKYLYKGNLEKWLSDFVELHKNLVIPFQIFLIKYRHHTLIIRYKYEWYSFEYFTIFIYYYLILLFLASIISLQRLRILSIYLQKFFSLNLS